MISILKYLNENIVTLVGNLKARGFLEDNEEKDKAEDKMDEETITNITHSQLDRTFLKNKEQMAKEC